MLIYCQENRSLVILTILYARSESPSGPAILTLPHVGFPHSARRIASLVSQLSNGFKQLFDNKKFENFLTANSILPWQISARRNS